MEIIKLTQAQYDAFENGTVTTSFEMLDVDKDGNITEADLNATQNEKIKQDIQTLLNQADADSELKEFSLEEIDALLQENAQQTTAGNTTAADEGITQIIIEGVENVDITNIKDETAEELQAKLTKIENNIKLIDAKIKTIQAEKAQNEAELKELEAEKDAKTKELNDANAEVKKEQELLDEYLIEYDSIQEEIEVNNNKIRTQQNLEEERYEKHMDKITQEAIENYDPEEHGDSFESYFLGKLNSEGYVMFSGLKSLNAASDILSVQARKVLGNITAQAGVVADAATVAKAAQTALDSVNTNIEGVEGKIAKNTADIKAANELLETNKTQQTAITTELSNRVEGAGLTGDELLAKISDEEKKLAIDNNVDITQCVIAMGKDKQWHIYQADGTSLARKYGKSGSPKGANIVPNGSGYMRQVKDATNDTKGARAVYTLTDVNADLTSATASWEAKTYDTQSPLSFDTNGDGVKTSTEKVNFDIDGDGKVDVVNNSADWVLAFDADKDGKVGEDGKELFGNNTDLDGDGVKDGYKDGFEALKALAKKEGLISDGDNALDANDLKKLEEKYGLKMTNGYGGEAKSLSDLGITQINIATTDKTTLKENFDGQNNNLMTQEGATFVVNGETREYADIWNRKYDETPTQNSENKISAKNQVAKANNLTFNLKNVEAIKGKVDYNEIKTEAYQNLDIPQEVLDKIIELEEEEEA